ncbi:leukocyte surface antigen CD53-like isoform 4-T6 [Acanthopagrus schlegelii]
MMHSMFTSLITTFWPIYPANTLVVTGTIVTCVCYLGVLGGLKENRCMLISFFILLFILMLVELAIASVFLVYSREIDTYFEKDLMQSLEIYRQSRPEGNKTIKDDFDAVQHLFRCCGVHGEADWKGNVPISCCTEDPCNTLSHTNWQEGCLLKLRNWSARNYLSTGAGVVTMFIIQLERRTVYFYLSVYHRAPLLPLQSPWAGLQVKNVMILFFPVLLFPVSFPCVFH